MKLHQTTSSCNDIDLVGEPFEGQAFTFVDAGGNECGCGEPLGACKAVSVGLAPPAASIGVGLLLAAAYQSTALVIPALFGLAGTLWTFRFARWRVVESETPVS